MVKKIDREYYGERLRRTVGRMVRVEKGRRVSVEEIEKIVEGVGEGEQEQEGLLGEGLLGEEKEKEDMVDTSK